MNKKLFIFFVLFWVCGRLYLFAPTYLESKIYHSIGLHIEIVFILGYLVSYLYKIDAREKVFWVIFFVYEVSCICFYTFVQFNCDHVTRANLWGYYNLTGSITISKSISASEFLFVPLVMLLTYLFLYKNIYRERNMVDKLIDVVRKDLWKYFIGIVSITATTFLGIGIGQLQELSNKVTISLERSNQLQKVYSETKKDTNERFSKIEGIQGIQGDAIKDLVHSFDDHEKRISKIEGSPL